MSDEFFTVEELANYLKLSESRVRQMIKANEIPTIKLGSVYRFSKNDIIFWMREKTEIKKKKSSLKGKNPREVRV